ncbi:hypothetical protein MARILYN_56 [Vibrio phage Marilyn]|nr:hypothetical protein MARILYN_56 [Vibrio phage Marilyn]WCD55579.1 hypothetical protein FAYDEN_56 [Vibrio phage Fayden]WCD55638.1 hypothetical protein BAYBAE_58 [Vibrio phage Baybae]WCD55695.1 hypothetical protein VAITEPHAGE_56 [Vibrio phage Vaitephage]
MAIKTCAVSAKITAPDGGPVANAIIVAELSSKVMQDGVMVPDRVVAHTDDQGSATLNLWSNASTTNPITFYMIIISTPQGTVETFYISVPDAPTANLDDLERLSVPDEEKDKVARLVAALADIESKTKADVAQAEAALQAVKKEVADFVVSIKQPESWGGTIANGQAMYPIPGATSTNNNMYDVVISGVPQKPDDDFAVHIDQADASNSKIELIGNLPVGREWWAVTRPSFNNKS